MGVGPWPGPWPDDPCYDPHLLAHGDRRNVVDRYRYWRHEAIVADLDARRHDFHVAIENWQHDLNIGTVVRTANAFLAREVHIVGRRRWNRRGAMVTDRYQHLRHHESVAELARWARAEPAGPGLRGSQAHSSPPAEPAGPGLRGSQAHSSPPAEPLLIIGIDNLPGSLPLETVILPRRCLLLFGQEGPGLSPAARATCDRLYSIAQYGSTRSINAGVASGIAMHAWIRAHATPPDRPGG